MIERFSSTLTIYDHAMRAVARPFVPVIGKIDWRLGRDYKTTLIDVNKVGQTARPGYAIATHSLYNLSSMGIPGFWKHVGMVIDGNRVIEAVGTGVRIVDIIDFIEHCDYYAVLDPVFANKERRLEAISYALPLEGKPYDNEFTFSLSHNKNFFCSEVLWWAYEKTYNKPGEFSPFTPKKVLGKYAIVPQDYVNAYWKWGCVATNRADKIPRKAA